MAKGLRLRLDKEELRRLYLTEKRSLEDIARLYGTSRVAIWKYCRDVQLARRSRSEARLEAQKRGKVPQNYFDINEEFFARWSAEMAYVLGLIVTDGCVTDRGHVSLDMNEKELLEKVRRVMCSQHKITPSKHQRGLYCFHFSRAQLVSDLARIGVLPRKSLNVKFHDVPDAFVKDFIRGVFDGDGTVYFEKRSKDCPVRAAFVSSSREFIESLESTLQRLGLPKRDIYAQKTKNGMHYKIRYSHENSKKLFEIMYRNIQDKLFMARKYNKFLVGFRRERIGV